MGRASVQAVLFFDYTPSVSNKFNNNSIINIIKCCFLWFSALPNINSLYKCKAVVCIILYRYQLKWNKDTYNLFRYFLVLLVFLISSDFSLH